MLRGGDIEICKLSEHLAVVGSAQSNIDLSEFVLNAAHQHCRKTKTIRRRPRRGSPGKVDQEEGYYQPH
jgi:hypothetical protein